ncbi:MAG: hypothetical protein R3253_04105, partial [Longimicrobiales bacterium]|nr:hypothetical protein [Longimicrobiales bacterium]
MRYSVMAVMAVALAVTFHPLSAQDEALTLGVFVTVRAENVPDFEAAAAEHAAWHASQNDSQAWPAYQALTGHGEYAILAPGMAWSDLDNPAVDMAQDIATWARQGAVYTETEEISLWTNLPGGNPPDDPMAVPIAQVFEFEVHPGGQPAVMDAIER